MKSNFNLSLQNIGNEVRIRTKDNFVAEGIIKSFTEKFIEIKDFKSKNVLTFYTCEILDLKIIKELKFTEQDEPIVQEATKNEIRENDTYDNPIFGRLCRDRRILKLSHISSFDLCETNAHKSDVDLYDCKYIYVNRADYEYENTLKWLEKSDLLGVSFYCNESVPDRILKYLIVSGRGVTLLIDLERASGKDFHECYSGVVSLLTNNHQLKVVSDANKIYRGINAALYVDMNHFIDIQVFYYGLHNIRLSESFKSCPSYSVMVDQLFNIVSPISGCQTTKIAQAEIVEQMAFFGHFLVPIYERMVARLIDPVVLLSRRMCSLSYDNDISCTNDDWQHLHSMMMMSPEIHMQDSLRINFDVLPRGSLFWSYVDNSAVLQARRLVDSQMQHERMQQSCGTAGGGAGSNDCSNIAQIKKTLSKAHDLAVSKDATNYYEVISDDDDPAMIEEIEAYNESCAAWTSKNGQPSSPKVNDLIPKINNQSTFPSRPISNESSSIKKIGMGRGRVGNSVNNSIIRSSPSSTIDNHFIQSHQTCDPIIRSPTLDNAVNIEKKTDSCQFGLGRGRGIQRGQSQSSMTMKTRPCMVTSPPLDESITDRSPPQKWSNQSHVSLSSSSIGSSASKDNRNGHGNRPPSFGRGSNPSVGPKQPPHQKSALEVDPVDNFEETEFCELSVHRWHRGASAGKLRLDKFSDDGEDGDPSNAANAQRVESMGIMWNTMGLKCAQQTDDLYAEFGL